MKIDKIHSLRSQSYTLASRSKAQLHAPKLAKEYACPNAMKNRQKGIVLATTMYKNNSRDSSKFKSCSPLQLYRKLKMNCSAVGYYSYTNRQTV